MCKLIGIFAAVLVAVFALWETTYSKWIILVLAVVLVIVELMNNCSCSVASVSAPIKK